MTGPTVHLHATGLAPALVDQLAGESGLPIGNGGGPRAAVLVAEGDTDSLTRLLRDGPCALVEVVEGAAFPAAALTEALPHGGLFVSLTTRTAWSLDFAALFCEALLQRGMLSDPLRHDVELSLHEATINAILHGNLELGMSLVEDTAGFDDFCRHLSARLEERDRATKRVEVEGWVESDMLCIRVTDEGPGYDPQTLPETDLTAKHGRGLAIMRTLAVDVGIGDGGRTALMRYA